MRGKIVMASLAAGLMLALPMALWAVDQPDMPRTDQTQRGTQEQRMMTLKATDVLGTHVYGQNQEKLGKIDNLVIDPNSGLIRYVVVACAEEAKFLPVPWQALTCSSKTKEGREGKIAHHAILAISREELKNAPTFQQGQWPDFNDTRWASSIERFYRPIVAKRAGETYNR